MAKDFVNLAILGHVNHGKSTLVGRLFDECGQIPGRLMARFERLADGVGQPALRFAFFTDTSLEERRRGLSVDLAYRKLETPNRIFNVIDLPGHRDFMRNAISGVWGADAAVLVVDACVSNEAGLAPQTKEHLILLKALDVTSVLVAINKMDAVTFSREAFELCKLQIEEFCGQMDYRGAGSAAYVPVSAVHGDNIAHASPRLGWYEGRPLLEMLEAIPAIVRATDRPLRMPIQRIYSVRGVGPVVTGTIESGRLVPGDEVVIAPYAGSGSTRAKVKSIERQHVQVPSAGAGDDVGILLTRQDRDFLARLVKKGAVLGSPGTPPIAVNEFKAELRVVGRPSGIRAGYAPHLHVHQASTPCRITKVVTSRNLDGADEPETADSCLADGETGVAWLATERPIVIEREPDHARLGRLLIRDGRTVAIGRCLEIGDPNA
jgi:elongation factor 1-alpha